MDTEKGSLSIPIGLKRWKENNTNSDFLSEKELVYIPETLPDGKDVATYL